MIDSLIIYRRSSNCIIHIINDTPFYSKNVQQIRYPENLGRLTDIYIERLAEQHGENGSVKAVRYDYFCRSYGIQPFFYGKKFHVLRQGVDVVSILLVIIIVIITDVPLAVREGTIIGMFLFGPMMGIFMKLQKPVFKKFGLIDYN